MRKKVTYKGQRLPGLWFKYSAFILTSSFKFVISVMNLIQDTNPAFVQLQIDLRNQVVTSWSLARCSLSEKDFISLLDVGFVLLYRASITEASTRFQNDVTPLQLLRKVILIIALFAARRHNLQILCRFGISKTSYSNKRSFMASFFLYEVQKFELLHFLERPREMI